MVIFDFCHEPSGTRDTVDVDFTGKVVLVAGGTGGLGRAVSLAFLSQGAQVFVTWRNQAELEALKSAAGTNVARLEGRQADVTDAASVERLLAEIVAHSGRLDALVNCTGGFLGGEKMWDSDPATLDRMLDLNLRSGFLLARAAAKAMVSQGSGAIINVAAKAGLEPAPGLAAYSASKAAAIAMMESLAADLKGSGVRANSILPNIIDTEANRRAMPKADFATWPKPEEIARVILFLCSDDARLIHGAAIPVYGNN